jgi:hypothetical protein
MNGDVMFGITKGLVDRANANAEVYEQQIAALQNHIAQIGLALAVEQAAVAGHKAELDALKRMHADSSMLKPSPLKFQDGTPKDGCRIIFETAFDAALKQRGIANPAQYRKS